MVCLLRAFRLLAIVAFICCAGGVMAQNAAPKGAPSDPAARAYTEKVAAGLAAKLPERKFAVIGDFQIKRSDPGGGEAILSTFNLYSSYKADPAQLGAIVDGIVATITDKEPPGARKLVGGRIVPVIKDRPWLEEARRGLKAGVDLLHEDYNEQLVVIYAVDTENRMRYIMSNEDIGDRKEMRAHAVDNLSRLLPKIEMKTIGGISVLSAGGDYEASLLLFDDIWRSGQIKVNGDIVVAVPEKNTLMITGSKDRKGVAAVRELAAKFFSDSRYSITDALFVYRNGRFVKYEPN
jgi:uncharacterized protein YtpQ (UPF0354 family)